MKKWLLLVLAALLIHHFGLWPFPETDAAELSVAKTLTVELTEDRVVLRTEQGEHQGLGEGQRHVAKPAPELLRNAAINTKVGM